MKIKYMHTIQYRPATYISGEQIVFAYKTERSAVRLCDSLKQIRSEQRLTHKYRSANGYNKIFDYGWVKVVI